MTPDPTFDTADDAIRYLLRDHSKKDLIELYIAGLGADLGAVGEREEPLDVERLAWALDNTPLPLMNYRTYRDAAEAILAVYARLSVNEGGPTSE